MDEKPAEVKQPSKSHVQLFLDRGVHARMRARAKSESLAVTTWIRQAILRELRRRPRL